MPCVKKAKPPGRPVVSECFLRRRSVLKTVDVLERARHDDVVVGAEDVVAGGEGDGVAVFDAALYLTAVLKARSFSG